MASFHRLASAVQKSWKIWPAAVAGLPLVLWTRDTLVDFCRVNDKSMEPTLKEGDILLVRKCDLGVVANSMIDLIRNGISSPSLPSDERDALMRYEQSQEVASVRAPVTLAKFYDCPPLALSGHIVVFKNPASAFPDKLSIKRVIGLGGQIVRFRNGSRNRLNSIPPYSLYVEGDNLENLKYNRQLGHTISKGLLLGVAEYILWPPSRWKKIRREAPTGNTDEQTSIEPRAFWP